MQKTDGICVRIPYHSKPIANIICILNFIYNIYILYLKSNGSFKLYTGIINAAFCACLTIIIHVDSSVLVFYVVR